MPQIIDLDDTKIVECSAIGCHEIVSVPLRAKNSSVKCRYHDRKRSSNPFEEGLELHDLRRRVEGRTVSLLRCVGGIEWEEQMDVKTIIDYTHDEKVKIMCDAGGYRWFDTYEVVGVL